MHGNTVCVIMQNPSEANELKADKSVQFLENLIFGKRKKPFRGVRKMIIVNQYAFVQKHGFEGKHSQIGIENDRITAAAIEESDIVLIAWGKNNRFRERKDFVFGILDGIKDKLLLETKKHPSRGFYRDFIKPLDIKTGVN